jgi:hypothetical protein
MDNIGWKLWNEECICEKGVRNGLDSAGLQAEWSDGFNMNKLMKFKIR